MRKEYDIEKLNPRKNLYIKQLGKQITMKVDQENVNNFKNESTIIGTPYRTLINLYLSDCRKNNRKLNLQRK